MITKHITNKAQFNNCAVADTVKRMPVTHILNHFPHRHSVNLKKSVPCGPGWYYPAAVLWLIHFFGELPAQMALSGCFMAAEEEQK